MLTVAQGGRGRAGMTLAAEDLAAEDLAANGAAIVRRFLSPEDAASLRRTVDEIYAFLGSCQHISNRLLDFHFHLWHGVWLRPLPAFLRKARPDLQQRYEQSLRAVEAQVGRRFGPS